MTLRTGQRPSERHIVVTCHAWHRDACGGSFRLAGEFAEFLAAHGDCVTFVCCDLDRAAPKLPRELSSGVDVRRYPPPRAWLPRVARLRYHVTRTARCVAEASCHRPVDVLSGHTPLQFLGAARELVRQSALKAFSVHSPFDDELLAGASNGRPGWKQRIGGMVGRWVDRRCAEMADVVQTDSQYTLASMIEKHGEVVRQKGVVTPGWVDVDRFRPVPDRRAVRSTLDADWQTDLPIFFTLRRLEPRMGLDTLIDAAQRITATGTRFRLLIGGNGPLRKSLEDQVHRLQLEEVVRFLGRLPEQQIPLSYAAADCFILPTRSLECFGLIVLESFAAGTPVIASRAAAIPELAGVQGDAWLFEPGSVDELAGRMATFLSGRMPTACNIRLFAERYSKQAILKQLERVVTSGIRSGRGS